METSLKTGFAQIFSCCPKNLSCPNFGGAAAPLAPPPARTPMTIARIVILLYACLVLFSPSPFNAQSIALGWGLERGNLMYVNHSEIKSHLF